VLFPASGAFGAAQTIIASDNAFSAASYAMDQGDSPPFNNSGVNQHNVTATGKGPDGKPLFDTLTIGPGNTTLSGTEFLTTGAYTFFCTIHPSTMTATLLVSANGTPTRRPTIALKVVSTRLDTVARKGGLQVQVRAPTVASGIELTAKLGKKTLGKAPAPALSAGTKRRVTIDLSRAARAALEKKSKATIKVQGTLRFGAPVTTKRKLK
jgi:plastocyanin